MGDSQTDRTGDAANARGGALAFFLPDASWRPWMGVVAFVAIAYRAGWALLRHPGYAAGEAANVAVALARGQGFADAFRVGQGASAHVLPIGPMIGGLVYRLWGVRSIPSEVILFLWSLLLVLFCCVVFAKCMERLRSPRPAVLGGVTLLLLLPIYTTKEVFDFRIWDGALGLALGVALLNLLLAVESDAPPRRTTLWLAILPAATFFVSPPIGLAALAATGILLWRHWRRVQAGRIILGFLIMVAALIGPWTMRNAWTMGAPIALRDDLGLELAVANSSAQVAPADVARVFDERMARVHPRSSDAAYRAMERAGGEAAYSQQLEDATLAWMAANPLPVARIWLRHAGEMLFTSPWMFQQGPPGRLAMFRSGVVTAAAMLGIVGLLAGLRRDRRFLYLAAYVLVPFLCYLPFQPITRYTWLIYPGLMFLATDLIFRVVEVLRAMVETRKIEKEPALA